MIRKSIRCLCLLALLTACGRERPVHGGADKPLTCDTVEVLADTMECTAEEEEGAQPLPKAMDELFDDFIFNFARNKHLQRTRIRFPLPVTEADGRRHTIDSRAWNHEYLFMQQDYYTVFFNDIAQLELEKRTDCEAVQVEWIAPLERTVKTYCFRRIRGMWMLEAEQWQTFEHYDMADFFTFYQHFATDSVFQRQCLARPLRYVTPDPDDDFSSMEGTLEPDQWFIFCPQLPEGVLTNIRYGQTYDNPRRMVMLKRGIANGMMDILSFEKTGRRWRLVSYEN